MTDQLSREDGGSTASAKDSSAALPRRRRSRRVLYVNEVDRQLLDKGLTPSWEQQVSESDLLSTGVHVRSNDDRLRENVPPHSHSRL